jgi:hypothetical protein
LTDGKVDLTEIKKEKIIDIEMLLEGFRKIEQKTINFSYLLFQGELLKCVMSELAETNKFFDIIKANLELKSIFY